MIATVFAVVLAKRTASGTALTVNRRPHDAAPLVLSLHASRQAADRRLVEVARAEWDSDESNLAYAYGPADAWEDAKLLEHMRDLGYLATVTEQVVEL